jgi:hypothetical protein
MAGTNRRGGLALRSTDPRTRICSPALIGSVA